MSDQSKSQIKLLNQLLAEIGDKIIEPITSNKKSENRVICGDSIDVLSILSSKNEIFNLVMIDPPYNENKSKGKYQDVWKGQGSEFPWAGEKHGAYLDFLYPRLLLSKRVLSDDGLIMLFIGDGEIHYVRVLLDQIFGEENYVGTVIWDSSSNQQKSKSIDRNHEYVLIYAKDNEEFSKIGLHKINDESLESQLYNYAQKLKRNDESLDSNQIAYNEFFKKILKSVNDKKRKGEDVSLSNFKYISPNYIPFYCDNSGDPRNGNKTKLKHPITKKECPLPGGGKGWRYSQEYLDRIINSKNIYTLHDGRVLVYEPHDKKPDILGLVFGKDEFGVPNTCRAYSQKTDKKVLTTTGHSYKGDKKIGIDPSTGFETVKPHEFLSELILNFPNNNIKVLDFFGGSGTSAVAVDQANLKDSGSRAWTLVELNEDTMNKVLIPKLKHFNIDKFNVEKVKKNAK